MTTAIKATPTSPRISRGTQLKASARQSAKYFRVIEGGPPKYERDIVPVEVRRETALELKNVDDRIRYIGETLNLSGEGLDRVLSLHLPVGYGIRELRIAVREVFKVVRTWKLCAGMSYDGVFVSAEELAIGLAISFALTKEAFPRPKQSRTISYRG